MNNEYELHAIPEADKSLGFQATVYNKASIQLSEAMCSKG